MHLPVNLLRCLPFFLLIVFPVAASQTVLGQKGSSITLPCNLSNTEQLSVVLTFGPKTAYGAGQDKYYVDRVKKNGSCDLILKDLQTTDAGTYTSKVYASSVLISTNNYNIHINVNLARRKDEKLLFDDLPREAESVVHFTDTSRKEVWSKKGGVMTDHLTNKNGRLTIENFTSSDAGIYSVLNPLREILINFTVTESGTESKGKLNSTHCDKPESTAQNYLWVWMVIVVPVVLIVFAVFAVKFCRKHLNNESSQSHQTTAVVALFANEPKGDSLSTCTSE